MSLDLHAFSDVLRHALDSVAVEPDLAHLALAVLLMGALPLTMVFPMTAACLLVAAALPGPTAVLVLMTGVLVNTAFAWGLARSTFGKPLERWIQRRGGALAGMSTQARKNPLRWSILCRFVPSPYALAPMVLASSGVPLGVALLGTAITMLPWAFIYVWAVRAGREGSLGSLALAATGLTLVSAAGYWAKRRYLDKERA
jgi:uncharacterized membrane protein YdjX (TVP38/TMEM64 family)